MVHGSFVPAGTDREGESTNGRKRNVATRQERKSAPEVRRMRVAAVDGCKEDSIPACEWVQKSYAGQLGTEGHRWKAPSCGRLLYWK